MTALFHAGMLVVTIAAIAQRAAHPLVLTIPAGLIAMTPALHYLCRGQRMSAAAATSAPIIAVAILVWSHRVEFDIAPLILVLALGAVAAQRSVAVCAAMAAAAAALLIGASITHRVEGLAVYLSLLATALVAGHILAMQRGLFLAERRARQSLREHAASEERRRIAREIHDVVAHSLAITLLHLTGARRELQQDADVDDAVNILVDAERLGRHAMADIRRTVGLLGSEPGSRTPEPGIDDIPDLIHDFETAGGFLVAGPERSRWAVKAQIPLLSNQEPQSHDCPSRP